MSQFLAGFLAAFGVAMMLVHYSRLHEGFTSDHDLSGVQKFHVHPVPRVGGLALMLGLLASGLVLHYRMSPERGDYYLVLLAALPAFLSGLHEDVCKRGGVRLRMSCIMLSAALAWCCLGARVVRIDLPVLDAWLAIPFVSLLFTVGAVTGLTNAMNLVDGYNGLACAVSIIMLAGIAYVAFLLADHLIWPLAIAGIGASLGFLLWNWPRGRIFLGDGGAYLLGFLIAELLVLLVARNPRVSPWFALLLAIYPIVETLFTILRRTLRRVNPAMPDAAHLHQLIYKRMMRWAVGSSRPEDVLLRNSMTSPYLWFVSSLGVIPAVLFWKNTLALQISAALFVALYVWIYRAIVAFRSPRWLVLGGGRK